MERKKITIELPQWAWDEKGEKRIIHVLAGIERIGYLDPKDGLLRVKTSRCSQCGRCCIKIGCEYLEKEPGMNSKYRCGKAMGHGLMRPYNCCVSEPRNIPECTSKYKVVS